MFNTNKVELKPTLDWFMLNCILFTFLLEILHIEALFGSFSFNIRFFEATIACFYLIFNKNIPWTLVCVLYLILDLLEGLPIGSSFTCLAISFFCIQFVQKLSYINRGSERGMSRHHNKKILSSCFLYMFMLFIFMLTKIIILVYIANFGKFLLFSNFAIKTTLASGVFFFIVSSLVSDSFLYIKK